MKKTILAIAAALAIAAGASAATTMKYQVLVCDADGKAMADSNLAMQVRIHQDSADGTTVFAEDYTVTTSPLGIAYLPVGSISQGTTLDDLDWGGKTYFLEILADRGEGLASMGTTQIMSVPRAIHADKAGAVILTSPSGKKFRVSIDNEGKIKTEAVTE